MSRNTPAVMYALRSDPPPATGRDYVIRFTERDAEAAAGRQRVEIHVLQSELAYNAHRRSSWAFASARKDTCHLTP
jgi:hypothetical protein